MYCVNIIRRFFRSICVYLRHHRHQHNDIAFPFNTKKNIVIWTRCDILSLHGRCHYLFFCRQWTSYTQCVCTLLLHIYRGGDGVRVKAHVSLLNHHDAFTRFCFQWVHGILVSTNNYKMIYINGKHKRCPFNSIGMRGFNHHRWFIPTSNHNYGIEDSFGKFQKVSPIQILQIDWHRTRSWTTQTKWSHICIRRHTIDHRWRAERVWGGNREKNIFFFAIKYNYSI